MLTTIALVAALSVSPGEAGELAVTNVRDTYGVLGTTRPSNKLIPGDMYCVGFDIDNVKIGPQGQVKYSMGMEVRDSKNKVQFKREPTELEAVNSVGGTRVPCSAQVTIGLDMPAGKYSLKVSVTDRGSEPPRSTSLEREFEVLPRTFGIVRLKISTDPGGQFDAPALGVPGQILWVGFLVVGFERSGAKRDADVSIDMQMLDETGKTVWRPKAASIKNLPADKDIAVVPFDFTVALNRPGKFTVKLTAADKLANKKAELEFPLVVLEQK
jgi:hypothetical protein